ncbi:MAG TPA: aminotransferase class I/II-fold pyridoxal phosphate-dependent enzyme [Acidimicrobiales bacterium]|jgi:dTDP-4-amino-4,6-dideoxygalactose transaminase|nr:aminotransferase class I/II-fold pyridoxal phosphate-dependent enzyme [Acidimicrobiales bacterium]
MSRIYLSPPDVGPVERALLLDAFDSNWIAPLGPHVDAFEAELAQEVGVAHALALASGTAALHLALGGLGVSSGDDVLVSTLTFVATANAVTYLGARPAFVDSDESSWNMDPVLLADELDVRAQQDRLPAAVVVVDLYGQCADYARLRPLCARYGVPLVEDAAEAIGASCEGAAAGSLGDVGVFSFNGNKAVTTSGGGMLVSDDEELVRRARHLSSQARRPAHHYEHAEVGYNYRLSNLLAAVGRGQLQRLPQMVERRRQIYQSYQEALADVAGVRFMPKAPFGNPTHWLTCITIDPQEFGATREDIRSHLEALDIEARPTWKPMHLQPVYAQHPICGGGVAERIFASGLCLPSGSSLTDAGVARVVEGILSCPRRFRWSDAPTSVTLGG